MTQNRLNSQSNRKGNDNTTKTRLFASKGVLIVKDALHLQKFTCTGKSNDAILMTIESF